MPRDLKNKVIAITGASTGIGAATALLCAKRGMHIALAARNSERLNDIARQIESLGGRALPIVCDVNKDDDVEHFIAETLRVLGPLDTVFANAGYGIFSSVRDTSDADARAIFETNFFGTLRVIRAALPHMISANHGRILICSSAASEIAPPYYGLYAATKAAQDSVGGAMRAELSNTRLRVITVHPVGTDTDFSKNVALRSASRYTPSGTPDAFRQSTDHVARCIVRAIASNNPPPEMWPSLAARFGLAFIAAFPRVGAWAMRRHFKRIGKN